MYTQLHASPRVDITYSKSHLLGVRGQANLQLTPHWFFYLPVNFHRNVRSENALLFL